MRNKDTGEFELVVGDKQLLSGFFIGIVLLAVVFAMGYVMGRGTGKSAPSTSDTAAVTPNSATDAHPQSAAAQVPPSAEPAASTPAPQPGDPSAATTAATPPVEPPPQPTTVPARDTAAPAPRPAPPADSANASYWQVTAAASRNSADAVSQTLQSKGFPATSRPGPNNLTVVWVGPYTDKESLTHAKKQLEDAGFNPIKKP